MTPTPQPTAITSSPTDNTPGPTSFTPGPTDSTNAPSIPTSIPTVIPQLEVNQSIILNISMISNISISIDLISALIINVTTTYLDDQFENKDYRLSIEYTYTEKEGTTLITIDILYNDDTIQLDADEIAKEIEVTINADYPGSVHVQVYSERDSEDSYESSEIVISLIIGFSVGVIICVCICVALIFWSMHKEGSRRVKKLDSVSQIGTVIEPKQHESNHNAGAQMVTMGAGDQNAINSNSMRHNIQNEICNVSDEEIIGDDDIVTQGNHNDQHVDHLNEYNVNTNNDEEILGDDIQTEGK